MRFVRRNKQEHRRCDGNGRNKNYISGKDGRFMCITAQQREKIRTTQKERIVLTVIEPRIMSFGKCVSKDRTLRLMAMSKMELQKLAQGLQGVRTLQEAVTMTVNAWTDSELARGVAEWNALTVEPVKA